MNAGEILTTAVSAVGTTICASDISTILEQTGTVSVPAIVVTTLNCLILLVNTGIAIYKKIRDIKRENKRLEEAEKKETQEENGIE